ncbi:MAG: YbaN family protein [Pseudomonadota bacterium]
MSQRDKVFRSNLTDKRLQTEKTGRITRILWRSAGGLSLALGIIGIFLPLLPTTPFLLLAAYCFQRSSPRLHRWLMEHRTFGPMIKDWQEHGAISRSAKLQAMVALAAVLGLSILIGVDRLILLIQIAVLSCVALFILSRPGRPDP